MATAAVRSAPGRDRAEAGVISVLSRNATRKWPECCGPSPPRVGRDSQGNDGPVASHGFGECCTRNATPVFAPSTRPRSPLSQINGLTLRAACAGQSRWHVPYLACSTRGAGRRAPTAAEGIIILLYLGQILWKRTNFGNPNKINALRFPRRGDPGQLDSPLALRQMQPPLRLLGRGGQGAGRPSA